MSGLWVKTQTNYFSLQTESVQEILREMDVITIGPQLHLITDFAIYKEKLIEYDVHRIMGRTLNNGEYNLGEYETEERALEVLSEIQNCIWGCLNGEAQIYAMPEK